MQTRSVARLWPRHASVMAVRALRWSSGKARTGCDIQAHNLALVAGERLDQRPIGADKQTHRVVVPARDQHIPAHRVVLDRRHLPPRPRASTTTRRCTRTRAPLCARLHRPLGVTVCAPARCGPEWWRGICAYAGPTRARYCPHCPTPHRICRPTLFPRCEPPRSLSLRREDARTRLG
jgi:hypothetical protein